MYRLDGNQVLNAKGVLIATLNGSELVMAPGKKSQEAKVRAYFAQTTSDDDGTFEAKQEPASSYEPKQEPASSYEPKHEPAEPEIGGGKVFVGDVPIQHVEPVSEPHSETDAEWYVSQIPADRLPPFSPQFGIETPGFREFVNTNQLNKEQTVALVRRLERNR
jgi:hypothetical protein